MCVSVKWKKKERKWKKERKDRAGQKREEMWVKLSGWEWWVVGLGGGIRGPQKNADLHIYIFFNWQDVTDKMLFCWVVPLGI